MNTNDLLETTLIFASVGQLSQQVVEGTFSAFWDNLKGAKLQAINALTSGAGALTAYFYMNDEYAFKAASMSFISGIFATQLITKLKAKQRDLELEKAKTQEALLTAELENKKAELEDIKTKILELGTENEL